MITISENFSSGVAAENQAWEKYADATDKMLEAQSPAEFIANGGSLAPDQYKEILKYLPRGPLNVLDIGVGKGQSSVFLNMRGHEVWAVEPNRRFCLNLESQVKNFGLNVRVCCGVGEDIDKIDQQFDVVFFNASLHHCDEPDRVLAHAYKSLKAGGQIALVNENYLRPWRSKAWFQHMLETDPVTMGHYGGNEHSYHNWEYIDMLKRAGFRDVKTVRPASESAIAKLEFVLSRRLEGKRILSTRLGVISRFIYYVAEESIGGSTLLAKASLIPCHFLARRSN